jgi:uncharacterized SAM-binding protein YcdF (DUF218 family)
MDLFFLASKVGGFLLGPSNLIVLSLAAGLILLRWKRTARIGRWIAIAAVSLLFTVVVLPVGEWLLRPLEQRFPPYAACTPPRPIAGIIVLGGAVGTKTLAGRSEEMLSDAADRIRYAATLARANPGAPVLVSGGQVFAKRGERNEAEITADILVELGVERQRIVMEESSRTTAENAAFASRQAAGQPGSWLLVTSAFHMPRSMGSFRKAGLNVIAAPTDWQVDDHSDLILASVSDRLGKVDLAAREYMGLIAYRLAGRTSELVPGPFLADSCT